MFGFTFRDRLKSSNVCFLFKGYGKRPISCQLFTSAHRNPRRAEQSERYKINIDFRFNLSVEF